MNEKILWYIADPMCSWCWGFMPVIEAIRHEYGGRLKVELLLGGLRPGTKEPMQSTQREEICHHWRAVQRMTGQPFTFKDPCVQIDPHIGYNEPATVATRARTG